MRYVYMVCIAALIVATPGSSTACEVRKTIRAEIKDRFASIEIDTEKIEARVHETVHAQLDRAKDRLDRERERLKDERKRLERERKRLDREANRDQDDDDSGWGKSTLLAFGLYGAGALLLLAIRSRRKNTE